MHEGKLVSLQCSKPNLVVKDHNLAQVFSTSLVNFVEEKIIVLIFLNLGKSHTYKRMTRITH